ncbi:MAG: ABC transporter permease [Anaerolineae bacterium]|nr:ABC transporter permease [Anaerolineae bacterium]
MASEPETKKTDFWRALWRSIGVPLGAIVLALLIGAVILLISGANPLLAYSALFQGAFGGASQISRTLEKATPLIFNGLAISLAFKAGMFNIGAQGQLVFGAIIAAFIGFAVKGLPWFVHAPLALICGAIAGALYGSIPGMLKAFTGASEVITTIMLNYVALNMTDWLVGGPWQDKTTEILLPRTPEILETARLDQGRLITSGLIFVILSLYLALMVYLFVKSHKKIRMAGKTTREFFTANLGSLLVALIPVILVGLYLLDLLQVGFLIAVGGAFFIWWLLERTTLGFEIRTVGANSNAARYAGINVALIMILTMVISGLLAGLGGAVETTGVDGRFEPAFNVGLGFDGITISLLGKTHPLGNIPAAILIGSMKAGSNTMQFEAGVPKEIVDVVQALMLFFVAADMIVRYVLRIKGKEEKVSLTSGWGQH